MYVYSVSIGYTTSWQCTFSDLNVHQNAEIKGVVFIRMCQVRYNNPYFFFFLSIHWNQLGLRLKPIFIRTIHGKVDGSRGTRCIKTLSIFLFSVVIFTFSVVKFNFCLLLNSVMTARQTWKSCGILWSWFCRICALFAKNVLAFYRWLLCSATHPSLKSAHILQNYERNRDITGSHNFSMSAYNFNYEYIFNNIQKFISLITS